MTCKGCGKEGDFVRVCCGWEGHVSTCTECHMKGKGKVRGHVCGKGMVTIMRGES